MVILARKFKIDWLMLRKVYKNSNKIDIVLGTKLALVASDLEHKRHDWLAVWFEGHG